MTEISRCFGCGHPVGDPPVIHMGRTGQPCATCVDRVLESIPPALPSDLPAVESEHDEAVERERQPAMLRPLPAAPPADEPA
jgi:hypothetical protein